MSKKKFKSWWIILVRGIIITIFGIMIMVRLDSGISDPGESLVGLSVYFGWTLFLIGIVNIAGALAQGGSREDWNWLLSEGMLDLLIGMIIMLYPVMTGPIVLIVIAIWGLINAVLQIVRAFINKEKLKNWWITVTAGIIKVFMVYLYLTSDLSSSAGIVFTLMGGAVCVMGLMFIILSFSIKGMTVDEVVELREDAAATMGEMRGQPKSED